MSAIAMLSNVTAVRARTAELLGPEQLRSLERLARSLARGAAMDADDLLQDALERAIRCSPSFAPGTNFHAWVRTIMQRLVIDEWRRARRRREISDVDTLAAPGEDDDPPPPWAGVSMAQVRETLQELPPPLADAFRMYAIEGLSYQEIAGRCGVPLATVGTRIYRARRRLRAALEARLQRQHLSLVPPANPPTVQMRWPAATQRPTAALLRAA